MKIFAFVKEVWAILMTQSKNILLEHEAHVKHFLIYCNLQGLSTSIYTPITNVSGLNNYHKLKVPFLHSQSEKL